MKLVRDDGTRVLHFLEIAPAAPAWFVYPGESRAIAVYADGGLTSGGAACGRRRRHLDLVRERRRRFVPVGATGQPAALPFGSPTLPYRITIGGEDATVDYFGAAGFVGCCRPMYTATAARGRAGCFVCG
ncbi:MAG: hypothetical protein R2748_23335 [Bryobacterales bacterium]